MRKPLKLCACEEGKCPGLRKVTAKMRKELVAAEAAERTARRRTLRAFYAIEEAVGRDHILRVSDKLTEDLEW